MTLTLNKEKLTFKTFEKIKKNKILMLALIVLGLITMFAVASKMQGIENAQGIFAETGSAGGSGSGGSGGSGGGNGGFMKSILDGMQWIVFWGIIIFGLIQFFTKSSRDFNLSEFIVHLVITVIIAWLASNFAAIIKKSSGAEINATREAVQKTENTRGVPDDIVEYVTPLGIVQQ